jgi:hypothetical protein
MCAKNLVGDFGLATSSLAAVDPSDVSPHVIAPEADMTLGTYHFLTLPLHRAYVVVVFVLRRGGDKVIHRARSPIKETWSKEP